MELETFSALLSRRARECPDAPAFTFLADGETPSATLSFAALEQAALAVAARLSGSPGERALLLYPPGLDFVVAFYGCLYAGVIAVPAYPPDPARADRTVPRLRAIAADADATWALSTAAVCALGEALLPGLVSDGWIATDTLPMVQAEPPSPGPGDTAFLQYTSGSTRAPRGVKITHGNLWDNAGVIARRLGIRDGATTVSWLPVYHDMGLMNGVLMPVWTAGHCVSMSPVDFIRRPVRWLAAMSRWQAEYTGGPNFAWELCVRRIRPEQRATLDLGAWRTACNGAEPIRASTLERFVEAFGPCGFRATTFAPSYGLAEHTVYVTSCDHTEAPRVLVADAAALADRRAVPAGADVRSVTLVGHGRVPAHWELRIVDPALRVPCAPGRVGEIWLSGASVGAGYWRDPEGSTDVFGARLATDPTAGPYLRTGDLGFVDDGELFVSGRLKDLVVIRGACHYPQDIEHTVEGSHPAVRPGSVVAFALDGVDEELLGVVAEVVAGTPALDVAAALAAIREDVALHHDLFAHTVALVPAGNVPKTSSGKIRRDACRRSLLEGGLTPVASLAGGAR